jgi:hypothetical protein
MRRRRARGRRRFEGVGEPVADRVPGARHRQQRDGPGQVSSEAAARRLRQRPSQAISGGAASRQANARASRSSSKAAT